MIRRPADPRALGLYLLLFLVGVTLAMSGDERILVPGDVVMLVSGCATVRWLRQALYLRQQERARRKDAERRHTLRTARRQREAQERLRRQTRREEQALLIARNRELREREIERKRAVEREEAAQRAERESLIAVEVDRLCALPPSQIYLEVRAIFAQRGYIRDDADGSGLHRMEADLFIVHQETTSTEESRTEMLEVVRCLPTGRVANEKDLLSIESWRREVAAHHAFLVSFAGFSAEAVRRVRGQPLTLVDANLLASWKFRTKQAR